MRYLVHLIFACCFFKKVEGYASPENKVTLGGGVGGTGGIAVSLTQDDFKNGAYIIDIPGVYTFQEDIVFRPTGTLNSSEPETWMFPDITTAPYNKSPFILGHFAGIIIQTDGVTLDLNGKTFSQSEEHALMQRFFALVELASSPFKPNVGPAAFGDASSFFPASNVVIENGKFGRSSHHAIHGNNNKGVTLRYLDISDFEVGGRVGDGLSFRSMEKKKIIETPKTLDFLSCVACSSLCHSCFVVFFLCAYYRELLHHYTTIQGRRNRAERRRRSGCGHGHRAFHARRCASQRQAKRGRVFAPSPEPTPGDSGPRQR